MLNVDAMLEAMTPEEFEERYLANELDPIDDSWRQAGLVAAVIHNEFTAIRGMLAGKPPSKNDFADIETYIPHVLPPQQKPRGEMTAEQFRDGLAALVQRITDGGHR